MVLSSVEGFCAVLGLGHTGRFQENTKQFTHIGESGICILVKRLGIFLFIGEYGTQVCKEPIRDAIGNQGRGARPVREPIQTESVYLLQFAEISAFVTSCVDAFEHKWLIN